MRDLGENWDEALEDHKKAISVLGKLIADNQPIPEKFIGYVMFSGESLSIHYADYKCEKCGSNELSIHHLIPQKVKDFMDEGRYMTSRYYWNQILVLCPSCHVEIEGNGKGMIKKMGILSADKIMKMKLRYEYKPSIENDRP